MFSENYLLTCDEKTIVDLYNNQYNDDINIPPIDMIKEEGNIIYKIYINKDKYICRVFEDPNSNFKFLLEEYYNKN